MIGTLLPEKFMSSQNKYLRPLAQFSPCEDVGYSEVRSPAQRSKPFPTSGGKRYHSFFLGGHPRPLPVPQDYWVIHLPSPSPSLKGKTNKNPTNQQRALSPKLIPSGTFIPCLSVAVSHLCTWNDNQPVAKPCKVVTLLGWGLRRLSLSLRAAMIKGAFPLREMGL